MIDVLFFVKGLMKMTENKRYIVKGTDDFFLHIEDTTLTEDKHEGAIYNIYQVVDLLNEQDSKIQRYKLAYNQLSSYVDSNFDEYMTQKKLNERIQELEKENKTLKDTIDGLTDTLAHTIDITPCGDVE